MKRYGSAIGTIWATLLLPLPGCSFERSDEKSAAAAVDCTEAPAEAEVAIIADALAGSVRRFARSQTFYHWGKRGPRTAPDGSAIGVAEVIDLSSPSRRDSSATHAGPVPLRPMREVGASPIDIAQDYFATITGSFFRTGYDAQNWNVGNGLYTATDPAVSILYGEHPSFLMEIGVPEGTKYLDLRQKDLLPSFPFKGSALATAMQALAKGIRCTPQPVIDKIGERLLAVNIRTLRSPRVVSLLSTQYTRDLIRKAFDRLGIGIIAATWGMVSYSACAETADPSGVDFVFTDPSLKNILNFNIFVSELEDNPPQQKAVEYERIRRLLMAADVTAHMFFRPSIRREFLENWEAIFQRAQFEFPEIQADPSLFFGCNRQFIDETRLRTR